MKKWFLRGLSLAVLPLAFVVFVAKSEARAQTGQGVVGSTATQQAEVTPAPTGNQVQNRNRVETQNQGENSQLRVNTQEQESLGQERGEGLQIRSQNAIRNMGVVARKVQELLQIRTAGGIGEQVRLVAREQNQAQVQIQAQVTKLDSKSKLARFLFGTDFGAVKSLKAQLEQNRLRIRQLEQLQNQLTNQGDVTVVQETIQAMVEQNTALQDWLNQEEGSASLLGWLFRLLAQ